MADRQHKASYSVDKKKGGYIIRVEGPNAAKFSGRTVPVTTRSGDEHEEKLERLIWQGNDQETGKPVALYSFEARPRDPDAEKVDF